MSPPFAHALNVVRIAVAETEQFQIGKLRIDRGLEPERFRSFPVARQEFSGRRGADFRGFGLIDDHGFLVVDVLGQPGINLRPRIAVGDGKGRQPLQAIGTQGRGLVDESLPDGVQQPGHGVARAVDGQLAQTAPKQLLWPPSWLRLVEVSSSKSSTTMLSFTASKYPLAKRETSRAIELAEQSQFRVVEQLLLREEAVERAAAESSPGGRPGPSSRNTNRRSAAAAWVD